MSEFLKLAETVKELGSTILIVAASLWLLTKYVPGQMRQQGEVAVLLRDTSAALERCTAVLHDVSAKDEDIRQSLQRIEEELSRCGRDVRYTKLILERNEHGK